MRDQDLLHDEPALASAASIHRRVLDGEEIVNLAGAERRQGYIFRTALESCAWLICGQAYTGAGRADLRHRNVESKKWTKK